MTSKEAIEIIKKYDDYAMARSVCRTVLSPQTIGSPSKEEFDEAVEVIEKDLKFLEILKSHVTNWSVQYGNMHEEYDVANVIIQIKSHKEGVHYTPDYKNISDDDFKFFVDFITTMWLAK